MTRYCRIQYGTLQHQTHTVRRGVNSSRRCQHSQEGGQPKSVLRFDQTSRDCRTVESSLSPVEVRCVKGEGLVCQKKLESVMEHERIFMAAPILRRLFQIKVCLIASKPYACGTFQVELNLFLSLNKSIHERTIPTRGVSRRSPEFSSNTQTLLFLYSYSKHFLGYSHQNP